MVSIGTLARVANRAPSDTTTNRTFSFGASGAARRDAISTASAISNSERMKPTSARSGRSPRALSGDLILNGRAGIAISMVRSRLNCAAILSRIRLREQVATAFLDSWRSNITSATTSASPTSAALASPYSRQFLSARPAAAAPRSSANRRAASTRVGMSRRSIADSSTVSDWLARFSRS
jgi:hypothetical protein